jgi:hypothetical protein
MGNVSVDRMPKVEATLDRNSVIRLINEWANHTDSARIGVGFCHWRAPAVTGEGEKVFQDILAIAAYALIIWNAYESMRIFDMRYEVAKRYANIAQDRWNRFNAKFRPLEAYMIRELMEDPLIEPDFENARDVYTDCATSSMTALDRMKDLAKKYCLCLDSDLTNAIAVDNQLLLDDMVNLGYQDEVYITRLRDIDRWNRRSNMLNLGRDLASISTAAARAGDDILDGAANSALDTIGQAIGFLDYINHAQNMVYSGIGTIEPIPTGGGSTGGTMPTQSPEMTPFP